MTGNVIIIGGVATGMKAAARLRRRDPEAQITVIEQGHYLSYGACGLPYFVEDIVPEERDLYSTPMGEIRDTEYFTHTKRVTTLTRTRAEDIDRQNKVVRAINLDSGEKITLPYDKLVIATGGSPIVPPLEGVNLKNIYRLSTIEDGLAIKKYLREENVANAVIVGAGLIGMEMVESLSTWGGEVSVVEMLDWVLPSIIDEDMGLLLRNYLISEDIDIHTGERVVRFDGDEHGSVTKVVTDKNELDADLVLLSIGVRPNVELAKKAGLQLGETGGIHVNDCMQTSDPDIYAGGDCVENFHRLSGSQTYVPMGSTANKHGRVIADHICGDSTSFPGIAGTAICRVFDYNIARTGLSEREARAKGHDIETIICPAFDHPHFYPKHAIITIKLIAERNKGTLLGAQIIGPGEVSKRIDVLVSAITLGATVSQIAAFDLAYSPPFSPPLDVVVTAANVMENKLKGLAKSVSPLTVKKKLDQNDSFILLDVRSKKEYDEWRIDDSRVTFMPLSTLKTGAHSSLPTDKEIITVCQTSLRGYEAQRLLNGEQFHNVRFMDGGMIAWPFETVGSNT